MLQGAVLPASWQIRKAAPTAEFQLFWGDLHNHNAVGYARGSLERTYEIARSHLDFLAFTPHAQWHDMPVMEGNAQEKWTKGFQVLAERWNDVARLAASSNRAGKFASLLAYEWHSSEFGDYCFYYKDDGRPLRYFDHVRKLQQYARETGAMVIPHHLAYKQGWRGANFQYFDPSVSPVIEIYSEHGLSESDRAPYDYITHSTGGRWTRNTVQAAMRRGVRAGFIGSTDDHLGYPGAWGEGLAGVWARDLSRKAIWEALWARRAMAATGDRISLQFRVNGKWMGSMLPFAADRGLEVEVLGQDEIERVEIVKNDRVLDRWFPADHAATTPAWPGEALCRVEFGWGPWGALNMARTCDWDLTVTVRNGKLLGLASCFQSGPFDERRRNRVLERSNARVRIQSYTSRTDAFRERATNSVVLHVAGGRGAVLECSMTKPAARTVRKTLGELLEAGEIEFTGAFQSESVLLHRLVTPEYFRVSWSRADRGRKGAADCYYARVFQANGQQAWSSPVWVEG